MATHQQPYGGSRHGKKGSPFGYLDARSYVKGMAQIGNGEYSNAPSYWRTGFPELARAEAHMRDISGLGEADHLLATISGEAAFSTALDLASPSRGDFVVHGRRAEYSKQYDYLNEDLKKRGVEIRMTDTGSVGAINETLQNIKRDNPDARIAAFVVETVGNGPGMPVVDLNAILSLPITHHVGLIIVDNTLPTEHAYAAFEQAKLHPDLKVLFIQSATKYPLWNQDTGGIMYTSDPNMQDEVWKKRTRLGTTPGSSWVKTFEQYVPPTVEQYRNEVLTIMKNTLVLARACAYAPGAGKRFSVSHPNLADHPNSLLARKLAPDGITPVFFITPTEQSGISAEELFYILEDKGAIDPGSVLITESFAFDQTGISHSTREGGYVRIAGGLEKQEVVSELAQRFKEALAAV